MQGFDRQAAVRFENVEKNFGDVKVLRNFDLETVARIYCLDTFAENYFASSYPPIARRLEGHWDWSWRLYVRVTTAGTLGLELAAIRGGDDWRDSGT